MCNLSKNGERACAGFLVDFRWVVTVAHCVDPNNPNSLGLEAKILCGSSRLKEAEKENVFTYHDRLFIHLVQTFNPVEIRTHESWNGKVLDGFDIAMVKLDREAKFARPLLSRTVNPLLTDVKLATMGWWRNASNEIDVLQVAQNISYVSNEKCNDFWDGIVKENQLCSRLLYTDSCQG